MQGGGRLNQTVTQQMMKRLLRKSMLFMNNGEDPSRENMNRGNFIGAKVREWFAKQPKKERKKRRSKKAKANEGADAADADAADDDDNDDDDENDEFQRVLLGAADAADEVDEDDLVAEEDIDQADENEGIEAMDFEIHVYDNEDSI